MGKRKGGTAMMGMSHFMLEALRAEVPSVKPNQAPLVEPPPTSAALPETTESSAEQGKAVKKRKLNGSGVEVCVRGDESPVKKKYDAFGLVERYAKMSEVPKHLHKYFSQRLRYFSLYDQGCLLDEEGWYSVTPELVAQQIAERCRCDVILDAFCGVGGNAIAFAATCEHVIAMDISPTRLALARHNAEIYGVADRIEFILGDYISFANSYHSHFPETRRKIDVVFLSPPWGGPSYLSGSPQKMTGKDEGDDDEVPHPTFRLNSILPVHGKELFRLSRKITRDVAYFLPRNTSLEDISGLLGDDDGDEQVEVEEEWMGSKLKALTCYFGDLVVTNDGS